MKKRIADHLIRLARRLDPNCCVDFTPLPTGPAVIKVSHQIFVDERTDSGNRALRDHINRRQCATMRLAR